MKERFKKHYAPLLSLVAVTGLIFYLNRGSKNTIVFLTDSSGYISVVLLAVSLIMGPLNLLLSRTNPVSTYLRRDISITGGTLAIIHSVAGLFVHLRGKTWMYFLNKTDEGYAIRLDDFGIANNTGIISALMILILMILSNDYFLKTLGAAGWKNIQRSSYLMFILVLVHCLFYRSGRDNTGSLFLFYMPILISVVTFQICGIGLNLKLKKKKYELEI